MGLTNLNKKRAILLTGKVGTGKSQKAKTFVENPVVFYANSIDYDIGSIPVENGIIIEDVHYKPEKDAILTILRNYRGQVVLTSVNEKSVPKELKTKNRDMICELMLFNKPSDTQILTWLSENMHPNRLVFVDGIVRRRWSQRYFYEMLSYAHVGNMIGRIQMPRRGTYSKIPSLSRRLGVRNPKLLSQLFEDEDFKTWAKTKLNNAECRLLKLGEKKRRKKTDPIKVQQTSLGDFI